VARAPDAGRQPALGAAGQTSGTPQACDFGDNPLTPAVDVFACNDKLIGGQPFIDTYSAVVGGEVYPDSARTASSHGTHTTTTAAGGRHLRPDLGIDRGPASGVAPAPGSWPTRSAGSRGCFNSTRPAQAQAILDGVNVINFSISGGAQPCSDVVRLVPRRLRRGHPRRRLGRQQRPRRRRPTTTGRGS
jgi:hypothetical protein